MSWKDAKTEATAWLDKQGIAQNLQGKEIDLDTITKDLAQEGRFREMIVRAIVRQIKARGGKISE